MKRIFVIYGIIIAMLLPGCEKSSGEYIVPISKRISRKTTDDGWVYTFVNSYYKDPDIKDDGLIRYYFYGINIKHRYDSDFILTNEYQLNDDTVVTEKYYSGILSWGQGEKNKHDAALIDAILQNATDESLMKLNPEDLDFTSMDPNLFCKMVNEALTSEPQKEGTSETYWNLPSFAALVEQSYIDGYKFQVIFLKETGLVDAIGIDVLFENDEKEFGYEQLSDICSSGEADPGQEELYDMLNTIARAIDDEDSFMASADEYKDKSVGGIELFRLYDMLQNIHTGNYIGYVPEIVMVND